MKSFKNSAMILLVLVLTFASNDVQAQKNNKERIVNYPQLIETLKNDKVNPLTRDFCQEITVTIDLVIGEVTTTIIICCSTEIYICFPNSTGNLKNANNEYPNDLEITNSASVVQNGYTISIKEGSYNLNDKGQILDLRYKMTKN